MTLIFQDRQTSRQNPSGKCISLHWGNWRLERASATQTTTSEWNYFNIPILIVTWSRVCHICDMEKWFFCNSPWHSLLSFVPLKWVRHLSIYQPLDPRRPVLTIITLLYLHSTSHFHYQSLLYALKRGPPLALPKIILEIHHSSIFWELLQVSYTQSLSFQCHLKHAPFSRHSFERVFLPIILSFKLIGEEDCSVCLFPALE